jgi:hypothetical protein
MPSEFSPSRTSRRQGYGHVQKYGKWTDAPVMTALAITPCTECGDAIQPAATFTKGGSTGPHGWVCNACRPHHPVGAGDKHCWLCAGAEAPRNERATPDCDPQILDDDTDLDVVARFFGIRKAEVFHALAPLIFDDRIERRLIWKLVLIGCERRHGGLTAIEQRLDELAQRRKTRKPTPGHVASLVRQRDGGYCRYCALRLSRNAKTMDHVIPFALNGSSTADNIVQCCRTCNGKKASNTPDAVGMYLLPPGTTRITIPPAKERRAMSKLPFATDWPALALGTLTYADIAARDTAQQRQFSPSGHSSNNDLQ